MAPHRIYGIAAITHEVGAKPATVAKWFQRGRLPAPAERLAMGPGVALV
jgi:hypothetical protein